MNCGLGFGNEISWSVCGLRDLTLEKPGKIFNLTLGKMLSHALGMTTIWDGTANILNEYLEKLSWFPDAEICWISALACSFAEPDFLSALAFELHFSCQWLFPVPLSLWFSLTVFLLIYLITVL